MRIYWGLALISALVAFGCGGTSSEGGAKSTGDPNAAVADSHWGTERVVYAADLEGYWKSQRTEPGGERWQGPPEGRDYLKFTYHGQKLTRLETFGEDGEPSRALKAGVRVEWQYAAHGGLLAETGYNEEGEVDEHNTRRYDASARLLEEMHGYGGGEVVSRVIYSYSGDSKHPTGRKTVDAAGKFLSTSTYTYSAGGTERTDKYEAYQGPGNVSYTRTSKQRWNADAGEWENVEE